MLPVRLNPLSCGPSAVERRSALWKHAGGLSEHGSDGAWPDFASGPDNSRAWRRRFYDRRCISSACFEITIRPLSHKTLVRSFVIFIENTLTARVVRLFGGAKVCHRCFLNEKFVNLLTTFSDSPERTVAKQCSESFTTACPEGLDLNCGFNSVACARAIVRPIVKQCRHAQKMPLSGASGTGGNEAATCVVNTFTCGE